MNLSIKRKTKNSFVHWNSRLQIPENDIVFPEKIYPKREINRDYHKWILITTCLLANDFDIRKKQYIRGITSVLNRCGGLKSGYNICIIENTGLKTSFLDDFNIPVLYTTNNSIPTTNKGLKELHDIFDAIKYFEINDNDFIVKITGRYYLDPKNNFFDELDGFTGDALVRFGSYKNLPSTKKINDCITGLIGIKCKYVKTIKIPTEYECVEWDWAMKACELSNVHILSRLGIWICPGSNRYFLV